VVRGAELRPGDEQPVEDPAGIGVAQDRGGLGEQAHSVEPLLIERQPGEVVSGELGERSLRLRDVSEACVDMGERTAEGRAGRILGDEVADRRCPAPTPFKPATRNNVQAQALSRADRAGARGQRDRGLRKRLR
jgi:hypothetical protein